MQKVRVAKACLFLVTCLVLMPTGALAQSAIGGLVTDATGGVLPGVTVEAASPALIEGSRVAVTDSQGRYLVIELRPGAYTVTFSLPGFATVVRDGITLPADFTATVSAQLRVGSIEETVTVTGASPVVDVQRTQRQQVLDRDTMDVLPIPNTMGGQGALIPAVRTSVLEVGSSQAMQGTYLSVYGANTRQNTLTIDGITIQSNDCDGTCFGYYNDRAFSETTFDTASALAETPRGGARVNMIPQEGGNTFSGLGFLMGAHKNWQSDNFTERLQDLGLRSATRYDRIYDINLSQGGPILPEKVWFYTAYRNWVVDDIVADSYYKLPNGSPDYSRPGVDDNRIQSALLRLTWQVNPRNKLAAHYDRTFKERFHDHSAGSDIETASFHRLYPQSYVGQAKWTATPSSRTLIELAYGSRPISRHHDYQEGIRKDPFTPAWYAQATRVDRDLGTRTAATSGVPGSYSKRFLYQAKLSYVTGSHAFKMGWESNWGPVLNTLYKNADLEQEYRSGVPDTVLLSNTPIWNAQHSDGDNSFFVQDAWTLDRLTLNGGLRFEWLNGSLPATEVTGGRFAGVRRFPERKDLPDWFDVSPRFGLAYDLFGTGKTALKFSLNRYMDGIVTGFAEDYSPMAHVTQRVPWRDLNGDDIAQGELGCVYLTPGCEFNVSLLPTNFGERSLSTPDPDIERTWNLLTTVSLDHELLPGFSVSGAWIRRTNHDLTQSNNLLRSLAHYTPVTIINPLNGLPITVYNLRSQALLRQVDIFDTNANTKLPADHPYAGLDRSEVYTGYELSFNGRLSGGATIFGGWTMQRTITVDCDSLDDPNTFRFCNRGGLDAESGLEIDMPFRHVLKLSGAYPLPYDVRFGVSFQSFDGLPDPVSWVVSRTTTYPSAAIMSRAGAAGCVGCETLVGQRVVPQLNQSSITLQLETPGERYLERQNLLSFSVNRAVALGGLRVELQADLFNVLNRDDVLTRTTTLGGNYGRPTRIMWARYLELSTRVKW